MATPFNDQLEVNEKEVRGLARYLIDEQKNHGVVISGTTGESPTLSDEEKIAVLKMTLDEIGDRAAVIFGCGSYNTAESIEMAKRGQDAGAHGLMAVNPYYNKPGQAGLEAHFSSIADACEVPLMLYNIKPRSAINLETDTLIRLAQHPAIAAVKEASGDIAQIGDVCRLRPEGFRVYSGDDALTLPLLALGGDGLVSVSAHLIGAKLREMIDVFPTDHVRAREIHHEIVPVVRAVFSAPSPTPVKHVLSKRGICSPKVRLPIVELDDEQKAAIDSVIS